MKRAAIAITVAAAMALMTVPGHVAAHTSQATDLNNVAYNEVWPVLGPGGATDTAGVNDALETVGLNAQERGGDKPTETACTHHADGQDGDEDPLDNTCEETDVEELTFYECNGPDPALDGTQADVNMSSEFLVRHSDLENGIFEATSSFFVPFELSGEDAGDVTQLWFGFATTFPWPTSSATCQGAFPLPGAYYEFYRGDTNGDNGWEIPINTLLVPDAPYGAVIRAMDDNFNTLAAAFVYANVNNHLNDVKAPGDTPGTCETDPDCDFENFHDTTPPYGNVFAASVEKRVDNNPTNDQIECTNGEAFGGDICTDADPNDNVVEDVSCARGIAVEYGEPLAHVVVDGASSFHFNPPDRDVDSVPITTTTRDDWGPGICIPNPVGDVSITAWDMEGNIRTQVLQ